MKCRTKRWKVDRSEMVLSSELPPRRQIPTAKRELGRETQSGPVRGWAGPGGRRSLLITIPVEVSWLSNEDSFNDFDFLLNYVYALPWLAGEGYGYIWNSNFELSIESILITECVRPVPFRHTLRKQEVALCKWLGVKSCNKVFIGESTEGSRYRNCKKRVQRAR